MHACRESRYILFLTENYAALDVLENYENYLNDEFTIDQAWERTTELLSSDKPYILFGSSFPKDKEYTQVMLHVGLQYDYRY